MVQLEIRPYRPSDKGRLGAIHDAARKAELCLAGFEVAVANGQVYDMKLTDIIAK